MHSPTECINDFVFLPFDMLDIKIVLTEKLQPPALPNIQGWLIKQILQTVMFCP
jgi:hypothetical protein